VCCLLYSSTSLDASCLVAGRGYDLTHKQCKNRFTGVNKKYMAIMTLMNNRTGGANLEIPDNIDDMANVPEEVSVSKPVLQSKAHLNS
jgi:hypothetical protein